MTDRMKGWVDDLSCIAALGLVTLGWLRSGARLDWWAVILVATLVLLLVEWILRRLALRLERQLAQLMKERAND